MAYLLNVVYAVLLFFAAPWLIYQAVYRGKYRQGFAAKLLGRIPRREGRLPCVWFHAVSVGEVHLLEPLISEIARRAGNWQCVVSTTTMTGFDAARRKYPDLSVFYCPLDFSWAVRTAMKRVRPNVLVLTELELWPNLIAAAKAADAQVAIVNGRLSEHSYRGYRRIRWALRTTMRRLDLVGAQNAAYAQRFRALGARAGIVRVTGSLKYDGARTDRQNAVTQSLCEVAGIKPDDLVFLAGSTQDPEEGVALDVYRRLRNEHPRMRLVLVPRHPHRFDGVAHILKASGEPFIRRTDLTEGAKPDEARVLLVDTVGELSHWWARTDVAFVGGSLGKRGGQNMIEPAAYGAAVCFGPNTRNFRDVVEALLTHEAAVVVHDADDLTAFVRRCLEDAAYRDGLGHRAATFVSGQLGAAARTFELLKRLMQAQTLEEVADETPEEGRFAA